MYTYNVDFGDEFKKCKINLPETIPVTKNFDHDVVLGFADIDVVAGKMVASTDVKLPEQPLNYSVAVAGNIISRDGNEIIEFDLKSVSIVPKQYNY